MTIKEDLEIAKEEVAALQAEYDEFIRRENPFKVGFDLAMYSDDWTSSGDDEVNKNQVINFENISKALSARSTNPEDFMSLLKEGWDAGWKLCHNSPYATYDMSGITDELNESDAEEFFEWQRLIISHGIYLMGEYFESGSDCKLYIDSEVIAERVCSYLVALFDDPTIKDKDSIQEQVVVTETDEAINFIELAYPFRVGFEFGLKFAEDFEQGNRCKYDIAKIGHELSKGQMSTPGFADIFQKGFYAGKNCSVNYIRLFCGEDISGCVIDLDKYSELTCLIRQYGLDFEYYYSDDRDGWPTGFNIEAIDDRVLGHLLSLFKIDETDSSLKVTPVVPSGEWTTCDSPTKAILDDPETLERFTEAWNNLAGSRPCDSKFA